MTAVVILNIVFALFVLVGVLSLLGWSILADRRATGADFGVSRGIPVVRRRLGAASVRRGRRLDPAV